MSNSNIPDRKKIFAGFGWSYAERMLAQIVSFVVSIILARLLSPEAYGTIAIANIFIGIVSAVTLTGFGSALIQKKEADNIDFSSALFFSLGIAIIAYIFLYLAAPFIARFFDSDEIKPIIRVISLSLIIGAVNTVQHAYVIRKMQFRLFFITTLFGSGISAIVGIVMAYKGYGVWALVAQYLVNSVVNTVALPFISDWRPIPVFSLDRIKTIYRYGWKIIASSVMEALYRQSRSLAIGVKYTVEDLAFYDKGLQFPNLLITNIDTSIANVLMPAMSIAQDDLYRIKEMARRSVKTSSVILFPLLIGLAVCSERVVLLLLTEKWTACVPYMQIICLALMMKPVQTANLQGFLAIGRSDIYLLIQISQKVVGILIILFTLFWFDSVTAIAVGEVVSYMLFWVIITFPNKKHLHYPAKEQLSDILPQLLCAVIMGIAVLAVDTVLGGLNDWFMLALQVALGAMLYCVISRLTKIDAFMYLYRMLLDKVFCKKDVV